MRLERIIAALAAADDVKATLRIFKLMLQVLIFIHLTTCIFFFYVKQDEKWTPNQLTYYAGLDYEGYDHVADFY